MTTFGIPSLDETTQQLARYAARGAERFHVGAESNGDSGHVNSAPAWIAMCRRAAQLLDGRHPINRGRHVD
jgi:hypothetical protein